MAPFDNSALLKASDGMNQSSIFKTYHDSGTVSINFRALINKWIIQNEFHVNKYKSGY